MDPFAVTIDFDRSHLVFPTIVAVILALLFAAILVTRRQAIRAALVQGPWWPVGIDQSRFFGTLALTIVYFLAMPRIGDVWPNRGLGFWLASIPFVLLISLLYLHLRTRRHVLVAALNALIAPTAVWLLLARAFNISLP